MQLQLEMVKAAAAASPYPPTICVYYFGANLDDNISYAREIYCCLYIERHLITIIFAYKNIEILFCSRLCNILPCHLAALSAPHITHKHTIALIHSV